MSLEPLFGEPAVIQIHALYADAWTRDARSRLRQLTGLTEAYTFVK